MVWLFPPGLMMGVFSLIGPLHHHATNGSGGEAIGKALFWASYGIYIALFIVFCRIHKWKWFGLACVILFCLLLLNVSGCQQMLKGLGSIN